MEETSREILEQLKQLNILTRVNNVLLSKFILQLQIVKRELHLPKLVSFFKFELLDEEYQDLCKEFDKKDVDNALWLLDRQMVQNKLDCPHNIKKFIRKKLVQKNNLRSWHAKKRQQEETSE